ncbi:MAG: hypothetical protein ACW97A_08075 [Candidatus Thorarchaeota archaeon]
MSQTPLNFDLSMKGPIAYFAAVVIVIVYTSGNLVASNHMSTTEFLIITMVTVIFCSLMVFVLTWYGKGQFNQAVAKLTSSE